MKVLMPGRILERHVGGNTTYARTIAEGLRTRGVDVQRIPFGEHPLTTVVHETLAGLKYPNEETVLHYVADTGPLVPTRTPSIVTVHGVASRWVDGVRSPVAERVWRTRVKRAISSTRRVITVSESSADDLSKVFGVPRDRVSVIPHGIDVEKFRGPREISDDVKKRIPDEFVLYVGNIEPRKNLIALASAFSRAELQRMNVPLVIAGKPAWDARESMDAINKNPNVVYLGFVSESDKIALMQRCAIFAFPSKYEGFGFPVLEAMAAGAPVVSSDRGSLKEVAGPARILSRIESDDISNTLASALNDRQWLSLARVAGPEWATSFSWERSINAHLDVYESVVSK